MRAEARTPTGLATAVLVILAAALMATIGRAGAAEPSAAERHALGEAAEAYAAAMVAGDMHALVELMPARSVDALAARLGLTRAALADFMTAASAGARIEAMEIDADAARWGETSGGRRYAAVPYEAVRRTPDGAGQRLAGEMVAFEEAGAVRLERVGEPLLRAVLVGAYPEFQGVDFAPGTATPID